MYSLIRSMYQPRYSLSKLHCTYMYNRRFFSDLQTLSFYLGSNDMESFVLAIAKKKAATKMVKELNDIVSELAHWRLL